ncbi:MAG TPA: ShlB/FhaC/HecB family hemolysin secretion/activation protein, partial [Gammaproteobacteria bacterium]|nr:ShlB/FhaC/HecB family hemolysin secretion/activation protein [Gammaproteobacteria bacterium]
RGFFLARAIIPAQTVENGVIDIRVLEGRLGDVRVEGNEQFSTQWLKAPFRDLQGELITVENVETALLTLKNYPGLNAYGVFKPGSEVGQADIIVNVQSEDWYAASVRADNHGTQFTGQARLLADFVWNNPISGADQLGVTALKTFDPDNALYGQLRYTRALPDPSYRAGIELSRNTFTVTSLGGINIIGIEVGGVAEIARIKLEKYFQRTRQSSVWGTIDLARKRADTLFGSLVINRDDLAVLGLQLNYERIDTGTASINAGFVRLDVGLDGVMGVPNADDIASQVPLPSRAAPDPDGDGLIYASSDFTKLTLGYSRLKSLTPTQSILFRLNGQYTNDILTTLEQFVIGGPGSVRAIPVSQFLADSGLTASLEYSVRAPFFADVPAFAGHTWGQLLGVSAFIDHGVGLTNNPLPSQARRIEVTGYGLGVQFGIPGMFNLNLEAAKLVNDRGSANPLNVNAVEDESQVWMSFTWYFN